MVLAHSFEKWVDKKIEERVAKAHEKGVAETNKAWVEWNTLRLEAEARGEEFNLPPPNGKV